MANKQTFLGIGNRGLVSKALHTTFLLILISFINTSFAQTRCELVTENCIDLTSVDGTTIQIPSNTTRIDNTGISICLSPGGTNRPPVNVIIIVDRSGSMQYTNDKNNYAPIATRNSIVTLKNLSPSSNAGILGFDKNLKNSITCFYGF